MLKWRLELRIKAGESVERTNASKKQTGKGLSTHTMDGFPFGKGSEDLHCLNWVWVDRLHVLVAFVKWIWLCDVCVCERRFNENMRGGMWMENGKRCIAFVQNAIQMCLDCFVGGWSQWLSILMDNGPYWLMESVWGYRFIKTKSADG